MSEAPLDAPVAELPGDGLRESIVDELRRHLGDALVEHHLQPQDDLWVRVRLDAWVAVGRALSAMGFTYFCFLSALDWKPSPYGRGEDDPTEPPPQRSTEIEQGYAGGETRFQVFARVTDVVRHVGITIKADAPDDDLRVESWHAIYAGANWHERETHEMFGIEFIGHPDLRNMYLPTGFEGFPLRKDFPLLARIVKPWPGIVDVEPMPVLEEEEEALEGEGSPPADGSPGFVSGETPDSGLPPDANQAAEFVSAELPDAGQSADANIDSTSQDDAPPPSEQATEDTPDENPSAQSGDDNP